MTHPSEAAIGNSIGNPLDRIDGRLKVTGGALYAADRRATDLAYGVLVTSTIGNGKIAKIETSVAEKEPGVLAVITHQNAMRLHSQQQKERPGVDPKAGEPLSPLQDDRVRFNGQPIAVVIADSLERAISAARLVRVSYHVQPGMTDFTEAEKKAQKPTGGADKKPESQPDYHRGTIPLKPTSDEVTIGGTYLIATEHHNPMELHSTVAEWSGTQLILHDKTQWVDNVQEQLALAFGMNKQDVRVISPFVGGAFGSALRVWPHVLVAALAARHVKRPVKLVVSRAQMFVIPGYRPYTKQEVSLTAKKDGALLKIEHQGVAETSVYEEFTESLLHPSQCLYACPNVKTQYRIAAMNVNTPGSMRGPGEASGMFALESALDELAVALNLDPVELRLKNFAEQDQTQDLPWSSNSLKECFRAAGERFGWHRRTPKPGSMQADGQLVGYGMATATWPGKRLPATVRVRLKADGTAEVETATSDIGPGTYTAMTQIAADGLGLEVSQVTFRLGDSRLPQSPVQGGSMTMASVGSAVYEAAVAMRHQVWLQLKDDAKSPLHNSKEDEISVSKGRFHWRADAARGESYADFMQRRHRDSFELTTDSKAGEEAKKFSIRSFGAHFVEVRVDPSLGTIRIARVVSAFAAGRIINPKTAHSQAIGGIVGGLGMALLEETLRDLHNGRVINANLADYHVPVHADVPFIDAFYIDETDAHSNPLGTKGL
ncbi:MAG: aerobic-type carbon monoxide dehydrogenase, partial [Planctomycetaceae bacterium]|nr:aerobic-type carbon monoxide dehydrogenase [Planctomycetaceae bacterium]